MRSRTQMRYSVQMDLTREIIVDNFAGGGGASTGIELATGRVVDIAVNHDPAAIRMHKTNHPHTVHYQASVWDVDPEEVCAGRPVGLAWFSPDCKHFSKAKGGKPVDKNIRGLSWVVLRWGMTVTPRVIIMENVEEIQTWGPLITAEDGKQYPDPERKGETFRAFIGMLSTGTPEDHPGFVEGCQFLGITPGSPEAKLLSKGLGYKVEWRELVASDYGAPTIRKRFFLIARCDGKPIVWPERTHAPADSLEVKSGKCKPWRAAAEIIDWSLPMYSVFESKQEIKEKYGATVVRPLADNTLRRVIRGTDKFTIRSGKPFLVECNHSGGGHIAGADKPLGTVTAKHTQGVCAAQLMSIGQTGGGDRIQSVERPAPTTVSKAEACLVNAELSPVTLSNTSGSVGFSADKPVHTITTDGKQILHAAHLAQYHTEQTEGVRGQGLRDPLQTVDAANRYSLVSANLVEYFSTGKPLDLSDPMHTVTSHDREALMAAHVVKFKGQNLGQAADYPLQTITAHADPFAVCTAVIAKAGPGADLGHWPEIRALLNQYCGYHLATDEIILLVIGGAVYYIRDILLRMLTSRELYNAMGFPPDYIIDRDYTGAEYGKTLQVARCGNAVPPPFATALVRANLPEWCKGKRIITMAELEKEVAV
ncbi:DNA cytosine methyltransferase [Vermiculatibacterium agrestimuris]|uniref:DNA cytosine methyltransferase n=1 Tax=Vermiculatibacterium agrestimuris TaxID=2941519 RepID=UPI00203D2884|nr:DNA cytosine methyltransferase [Vermiculatibacterium agrestimuris]